MRRSAGSVVGSLLLMLLALTVAGCAGSGRGGLNGKRAEVVSAALSQVGTPYHFGGSQPGKALDCSGLTLYAHHVAGIPIPRHSADQLRAAHPVKAKSLRPGDLVFFGSKGGVDHVGLMVDAERFVHASMSKRRVILSRLDTPYWRAHFAGAGTYLR
jgi:cell wall-associated NlpC family hydrolase